MNFLFQKKKIPHVFFLDQCPAGKKFGEIYTKIAQKSNTKNKFLEKIAAKIAQKSNTTKKEFLEENAAKIVLFEEKKTFFNFLLDFRKKKKQ